jgi:hypothetical protein
LPFQLVLRAEAGLLVSARGAAMNINATIIIIASPTLSISRAVGF